VVKVAKEVVREELHGGEELAAGSAGWGNNRSGLPLVRCLRRKTTTRKSSGLASLADTAGMLLV
jgi:hypothetical protein